MDENFNDRGSSPNNGYSSKGYALSGKIMLSAIVILFAVVIVMVCLHLYARWYLLRARRRQLRRNRRRTHLVFYVDPANPTGTLTVPATNGLDASLLKSLPVFVYSEKTHPESLECAVCLSEFEENEKGRSLPKCNHSFHTDCIDMWFHSHSTCPICRAPVESSDEVVVDEQPVESEAGSSSGLCSTCKHDEEGGTNGGRTASTSSFGARRRPLELMGVSIEVPRRNNSFGGRLSDDEFSSESPASQVFKSPGSRILSLKRILSRGLLSPSSSSIAAGAAAATSCGGSEFDIERGRDESTQPSRVQTPR